MGIGDKFDEVKGQAKESYGDATGNEKLEAEGKDDQVKAKISQAGDKAKDALDDVKDAFKK